MKRFVMLLVVLLLFGAPLLAQAANLAWKLAKGDEQNYRLTQSSRLTGGTDDENKHLASVEQVLELTWKVLEVSESGNANISLEVTAFSLLAKGPDGQEVRYDSESAEEPQGYAAMLAPIGKRLAESPVLFQMNAHGEISEVEVPDDLAEAVKLVPGGKKFAQDGGLASVKTMARLGAPLKPPRGEVTPDQKWSSKQVVELPVLGATEVEFFYQIAGPVSADEITVEQQMVLASADGAEAGKFNNQQSTGTIVWDAATGRPETSVLNYEVEIEQPPNAEDRLKLEQHSEFRRIADETQ